MKLVSTLRPLVLKEILQISGETKCNCNQDQDCEDHEQCSGGNCISACALVSCRPNANCMAENHKMMCKCREGYSRVGSNKCQKGKTQSFCQGVH